MPQRCSHFELAFSLSIDPSGYPGAAYTSTNELEILSFQTNSLKGGRYVARHWSRFHQHEDYRDALIPSQPSRWVRFHLYIRQRLVRAWMHWRYCHLNPSLSLKGGRSVAEVPSRLYQHSMCLRNSPAGLLLSVGRWRLGYTKDADTNTSVTEIFHARISSLKGPTAIQKPKRQRYQRKCHGEAFSSNSSLSTEYVPASWNHERWEYHRKKRQRYPSPAHFFQQNLNNSNVQGNDRSTARKDDAVATGRRTGHAVLSLTHARFHILGE